MSTMKKLFLIGFLFILNSCQPAFAHPLNMEVLAMIESSNDPKAWNKKTDARGLYQITPIVLKQFNSEGNEFATFSTKDLYVRDINRLVADYYLNWLDKRCNSVDEILIAWNWGIGNLRKWQKYPWKKLPKETKDFIEKYHALEKQKKVK